MDRQVLTPHGVDDPRGGERGEGWRVGARRAPLVASALEIDLRHHHARPTRRRRAQSAAVREGRARAAWCDEPPPLPCNGSSTGLQPVAGTVGQSIPRLHEVTAWLTSVHSPTSIATGWYALFRDVSQGTVYDLGQEIRTGAPRLDPFQLPYSICMFTSVDGTRRLIRDHMGATNDPGVLLESIHMTMHTGTHIDALGHFTIAAELYGGRDASAIVGDWGLAGSGSSSVHRSSRVACFSTWPQQRASSVWRRGPSSVQRTSRRPQRPPG